MAHRGDSEETAQSYSVNAFGGPDIVSWRFAVRLFGRISSSIEGMQWQVKAKGKRPPEKTIPRCRH
jgi:hypothetical protein